MRERSMFWFGAVAMFAAIACGRGNVTMANYDRVKPGMTVAQVNAVFGAEGTEQASSQLMGVKHATYAWKAGPLPGAAAIGMFQNGHLVSKSQVGLK